jgi:hypothetical protein
VIASLVSQQGHDVIFSIGAAILAVAMLPAVRARALMPAKTCAVTGGVLAVFVLNYTDMHFWYAMTVESLNVAAWSYLLWVAWTTRYSVVEDIPPAKAHDYELSSSSVLDRDVRY